MLRISRICRRQTLQDEGRKTSRKSTKYHAIVERAHYTRGIERRRIHYSSGLTASLNFGRNQANFIHTGGMSNVNYVCHIGERNAGVALYEHHLLGAGLVNIG
jgi:hypothetical protein